MKADQEAVVRRVACFVATFVGLSCGGGDHVLGTQSTVPDGGLDAAAVDEGGGWSDGDDGPSGQGSETAGDHTGDRAHTSESHATSSGWDD
jgi:hypothetical protein